MTPCSESVKGTLSRGAYIAFKRSLDVIGAAGLLLLVSWLVCLVACIVRLRLGRPVFFRQQRPGLGGRPFTLVKFRTMSDARDSTGALLPDDQRLTRLGRFLRSTSLDELPTLWNVLKGDMSFVGPRPLLMSYVARYTPEQARRHEVRPGITGWAQVHGRNDTTWEARLARDVWYVDNKSSCLDIRILARTLVLVLARRGINHDSCATMPELTISTSQDVMQSSNRS